MQKYTLTAKVPEQRVIETSSFLGMAFPRKILLSCGRIQSCISVGTARRRSRGGRGGGMRGGRGGGEWGGRGGRGGGGFWGGGGGWVGRGGFLGGGLKRGGGFGG